MVSNDIQAKQQNMIPDTNVFSRSTKCLHPPEITEEQIAETRCNLLGKQDSDESFRDSVMSYTNVGYWLSHTQNLPEGIIAHELRDI